MSRLKDIETKTDIAIIFAWSAFSADCLSFEDALENWHMSAETRADTEKAYERAKQGRDAMLEEMQRRDLLDEKGRVKSQWLPD